MAETRTKSDGQAAFALSGGETYADYAEVTSHTAQFANGSHDFVDTRVDGYIRTLYRDAILLSLGWVESIQADNDPAPAPALVVQVLEVSSPNATAVPRSYTALDFLEAPEQLQNAANPAVVFCYLEPGTPTDPPVLRKMKRTRVIVH